MSVLASGSEDGSIRIWNVNSGECLQTILGHEKRILSLESIGTSRLASSSLDNTICVWSVDLHFCPNSLVFGDNLYSLQMPQTNEPDDPVMFVVAFEHNIQVWDSTTRKMSTESVDGWKDSNLECFIIGLASVDEHRIACGLYKGSIQIWHIK